MDPQTVKTKQVILVSYANEGPVTGDHLKTRETQLNVNGCKEGEVAVQNLWISVDPYLRLLMKEVNTGLPSQNFTLGEPIVSRSVSKVVASANPEFHVGDIVLGYSQVSEYATLSGSGLTKLDAHVAPLPYCLGLLGSSGLTAYVGLIKIGEAKPGDEVFVSAAAGAVGLVVGQLAKIKGCRVVGSASSNEKVKVLKEEFGFDDAFNYKAETDWDAALTKYFPKGIDIYFENVGGHMLEAVLNHINLNARIPVCGMISQYNENWKQHYGVRNLLNLVGKCAKMQGFTVRHYLDHMDQFREEMIGYIKEGKIKYSVDVKQGIDSFLEAFNSMLGGKNIGKTLLQL
uniref:Enoyl reductase (ER) domain-containing protein n=1 Tax=Araucaria cunninghamii TaxID=56994 RepID=A0A0D6QVZ8_ARACU